MRLKVVAVIAVAFLILAAGCRHNEQSVTGMYGTSVVTGQATMADGGSPAGVEVSLGSTGMTTTLTADGRFTFANAPENATLHFRRGDGIDASVAARSGQSMQVVLAGSSSGRGRSRGAISVPGVGYLEVEGVVSSATAASLVVTTEQKGDVTVTLTPTTIIRKGQAPLAATDLTPGTEVHVKGTAAAGVNTALEVIVQMPEGGIAEVSGTVTTVGASSIVVLKSGGTSVTVNVSPTTLIRKQGTVITIAGITVGDTVEAVGVPVDAVTLNAYQIQVESAGSTETEDVEISGPVTAVGASSITVNGITVNVDANTTIRSGKTILTVAQIQVGDLVEVDGTQINATTILAKKISVEKPETQEAEVEGTVTAVGASSITVNGQTVNVDASTIIRKKGSTIPLAQIQVGDEVDANGSRIDATTILAARIQVSGGSGGD